jgi:hypothetical protein
MGGRRNCAGLAGERKEVELGFFLFSSLDYATIKHHLGVLLYGAHKSI